MRKNSISTLILSLVLAFVVLLGVAPATAQDAAADAETAAAHPRVQIVTNHGTMVLELRPDVTPKTVENFLAYVADGFYDGTIFHRVIPEFMVQGGGYTPDMVKKDTRAGVENESPQGLANSRGTIAMARTNNPHSATSQFFINVVDNNRLDSVNGNWGYTAFGSVVEGMEVADAIAAVATGRRGRMGDVPVESVIIEKIAVVGAGD